MVGPSSFDAFYYSHCCGKPYERNTAWLEEFGCLADRIVADMHPGRVLDAGCAIGLLVEVLRDRGVQTWGVDISSFAIGQVYATAGPYCREGSIAEPFGERFDLITCIEVVEHMPPAEAERAIANMCAHADDILFSSSPMDYREPTHINVHPPEHWAELFARHGFLRDVDYDASFVTPWAARFRMTDAPVHRIVRDLERRAWASRLAEHDARAYAIDVQGRLAHATTEVADVRAAMDREVALARASAAAEVADVRAAMDREVALVQGRLAHATAEVADVRAAMDREVALVRASAADEVADVRAAMDREVALVQGRLAHAMAEVADVRAALDREVAQLRAAVPPPSLLRRVANRLLGR